MQEKIYRDADVDMAPLKGKTVAVIGYGIQGKAQAAMGSSRTMTTRRGRLGWCPSTTQC